MKVGAPISCTVEGLDPAHDYDFLAMSYRLVGNKWAGAKYSNVASGTTASEEAEEEGGDDVVTPGPAAVTDLAIGVATGSSVTLEWTQIDDGMGEPARYRVKYASPAIEDWSTATVGCDPRIIGSEIGAPISCTAEGLSPSTAYEFQLMSYRLESDGSWAGAQYSNLTATSTASAADAPSTGIPSTGIWIDRQALMQQPTSGANWQVLLTDAGRSPGSAAIADQDSNHDVYTMAAALVCVRTGQYCTKARQGVVDAIGTEQGGRWLAVGRNLAGYMIAADLLDLRADGSAGSDGTRFEEWAEGWLTKQLPDNVTGEPRGFRPFGGSANAAAQEGLAYAAVAAYLQDEWALQRAWDSFRTAGCDPTAPDRENIYLTKSVADGWTHDDVNPCSINPKGSTKVVPAGSPGAGSTRRLDGSLTGDMRRGGTYQWVPGYTQYPWVGLEGFVPAAVILDRAGYPAFQVADQVVLRTHEYLWHLRSQTGDTRWFDGDRAKELVHLVNVMYGTSFPVNAAVGRGRTVGYTGWTHTR
jgi:hypothetical protein